MHVVWQNYIPPNRPAVSASSCAQFIDENRRDVRIRQDFTAPNCASRYKVNRLIYPTSVEAPKVTMHPDVVAGIGDPGRDKSSLPAAGITDPGYNILHAIESKVGSVKFKLADVATDAAGNRFFPERLVFHYFLQGPFSKGLL